MELIRLMVKTPAPTLEAKEIIAITNATLSCGLRLKRVLPNTDPDEEDVNYLILELHADSIGNYGKRLLDKIHNRVMVHIEETKVTLDDIEALMEQQAEALADEDYELAEAIEQQINRKSGY